MTIQETKCGFYSMHMSQPSDDQTVFNSSKSLTEMRMLLLLADRGLTSGVASKEGIQALTKIEGGFHDKVAKRSLAIKFDFGPKIIFTSKKCFTCLRDAIWES